MSSTMQKLWNGHLAPVRYSGADNDEIKEILKTIDEHIKALEAELSDEGKAELERYRVSVNDYIAMCSEQAFCDGYAMGTRLTAEAMIRSQNSRD